MSKPDTYEYLVGQALAGLLAGVESNTYLTDKSMIEIADKAIKLATATHERLKEPAIINEIARSAREVTWPRE